jgi:RHS repeat-associated protein
MRPALAIWAATAACAAALLATPAAALGAPHGAKSNLAVGAARLTSQTSVAVGAPVAATVTIRNGGRGASTTASIALFLSKDARRDTDDFSIGSGRLGALRPRRTTKVKLKGKVPGAAAAGRWTLLACVVASRRLRQTTTKDDCRTVGALTIRGGAHGPVGGTSAPVSGQSGSPLTGLTTPTPATPTTPTTPDPPAPTPVIPALSVADAVVDEGDEGTHDLVFPVTIDRTTAAVASAAITLVPGSAASGADFQPLSGRLTITPGTLSTTVTVRVNGDVTDEADETLRVVLSDPRNATLARGEATGTIRDDDLPPAKDPRADVDDVVTAEGDAGTHDAVFTVRLDAPAPSGGAAVHVHTVAQTADDPADFHGVDLRVALPAGAASATVAIPVVGDTAPEADETFVLQLSDPEHVTLGDAAAAATIQDDDHPVAPPEQPDAPHLPAPLDPEDVLQGTAAQQTSASFADSAKFLYDGDEPIQTGVAANAIDETRAAILRGRVTDAAGQPIAGARVRIHDDPALGQTGTRADGRFDLAVNGGGDVTVDVDRTGYLSSQRAVPRTPWGGFAAVDDIVLRRYDSAVTDVAVDAAQPQVASSTPVDDAAGRRRSSLLFMPGTTAEATLANGTKVDLGSLGVRSTEYTSGTRGPEAMPGKLPPTSGFTFAAELSADEAVKLGATDVHFSRPVIDYVDNFLGFKAGMAVPTGYYDRDKGQWIPSRNGLVIAVVSESGGLADVDVTGEGVADGPDVLAAKGITEAERRVLAQRFDPGDSLWRVEIQHFTPWDYNWPYAPPDDAEEPCGTWDLLCKAKKKLKKAFCDGPGSIIECERQTLREQFAVPGTSYTLNYASDRGTDRPDDYRVPVKVTGPTVPKSLKEVRVTLEVAGRTIAKSFSPDPSQTTTIEWDGLDVYGRRVTHPVEAKVRLSYIYPLVYQAPANFAASFARLSGEGTTVDRAGMEVESADVRTVTLGSYDPRPLGLGGLTLSDVNAYDPASGTVFLGDGSTRTADTRFVQSLEPFGGTGVDGSMGDGGPATAAQLRAPVAVSTSADGSILIADQEADVVRRIAPDGTIATFAGNGEPGDDGDGGPATAARLYAPSAVAATPEGGALIAESQGNRIRLVSPTGRIATVAGGGAPADGLGDGAAASAARLHGPSGVAPATGGGFYVADTNTHRVRLVGADGVITTVAGDGAPGDGGDGGPAAGAQLDRPTALAVDGLGRLLIADTGNHRVRRVGLDGRIETLAGGGAPDDGVGDGGRATDARMSAPVAIAITADGDVLIADRGTGRVRRIYGDGTIGTLAGSASAVSSGTAVGSRLLAPAALAVTPDGRIVIGERDGHRLVVVGGKVAGIDEGDVLVPSDDGSEVWQFRADGRHVRTLSAYTGAVIRRFSYDSAGRLTTITSGTGPVTRVERAADGTPTAIVGPSGAKTALKLDSHDRIATITTPAGHVSRLTYDTGGLLTGVDDAGTSHEFAYDDEGRLTLDRNPAKEQTLVHSEDDDSESVTLSVTGGSSMTYTTRQGEDGTVEHTIIRDDHLLQRSVTTPDGTTKVTDASGVTVAATTQPDDRFGNAQARAATTSWETAGGAQGTIGVQRSADGRPATGNDPFAFTSLSNDLTAGDVSVDATFAAGTRTTSARTRGGRTATATLDADGRVVSAQLGNRAIGTYTYDDQGRSSQSSQGGRTYETEYGADGLESVERDPLGREKRFVRDADGRPTSITLPGGHTSTYTYDALGGVTSVTPAGRPAQQFTFDATGGMTSATRAPLTDAAGAVEDATTHYDRDQTGRLVRIRRPGQPAIEIAYADGRMSGVTAGGEPLAGYAYADAMGTVSAITGPDANVAFTRDGPLVLAEQWSGAFSGTLDRTVDAELRTRSLSFAGVPITDYEYDADGAIQRAGPLTVTRDVSTGDPVGTDAGDLHSSLDRSSLGEVKRLRAAVGGTSVFDEELTRDDLGRVTHSIVHDEATTTDWAYTYADDGALSEVRRDGTLVGKYAYDANGNRTSATQDGVTVSADYDRQDALTRLGQDHLTYRKSGEMVRRDATATGGGITSYNYDARGALRGVTLPTGGTIGYQLDGAGRRVGRRVGSGPWTHWVYTSEGTGPAVQLADDGSVEARFVYGSRNEVPDLMLRDGKTYALITDHVGSVRRVVDVASGEVAQRLDYEPWGRVTTDTRPGFQPFGFAGGLYDGATGLVRFGARDYDASLGRWTAPDPAFAGGGDTNLYRYINDDPVNLRDPSGRFLPILAAAGVGGLVGCGAGVVKGLLCQETPSQIMWGCAKGFAAGAVGTLAAVGVAALLPASASAASMLIIPAVASSTASASVNILTHPGDYTVEGYLQEIVIGSIIGVGLKAEPGVKTVKAPQHPGHPITNTVYSDHPTIPKRLDYEMDQLYESGQQQLVEKAANTDVNLVVQGPDPDGGGW